MRKTLSFTVLALASGLVLAQAAPTDREAARAEWRAKAEARFAEADKDKDGRLDKVEVQAYGDRLARHFDRIDADADGELSKEELAQARKHARHGRGGKQGFAHGLFKGMDDDGNGAISRAELGDKAPRLAENFAAIDADGNGELTREEMKQFRKRMHAERTEAKQG